MSRTKLTSTILTQLEENQRLRIQLHHYQNLLREQDNFYQSALNNQEKTTKNILDQLILTEVSIKQLVKSRICNNWKQQYDNLSENISQYVKDVNQLVLNYNCMRQDWVQKMQQKSDLYKYYSQTLQECVQKFDKAQQLIQEMNQIIEEKDLLIQKKDQQIKNVLKAEKNNNNQQQLQKKIIQATQSHENQIQNYLQQIIKINKNMQALKQQNQLLTSQNKKKSQLFKQMQVDYDLLMQKVVSLEQKSQILISQNQRLIALLQKFQKMQGSSKKQLSRVSQNQQQIIKKSILESQKMAYLQKTLAQIERQNNQLVKMQKQWINAQQDYQKRIHNYKLQIQHHQQLVFDLNSLNETVRQQLDDLFNQFEQYKKKHQERQQAQLQRQKLIQNKDQYKETILKEQYQQRIKQLQIPTNKKNRTKKQLLIHIQHDQSQEAQNINERNMLIRSQGLRQRSNNLQNQNYQLGQQKIKKSDISHTNNGNAKKFNLQTFQIKNMHFQHGCCSPKLKMGNLHNWNNFPF